MIRWLRPLIFLLLGGVVFLAPLASWAQTSDDQLTLTLSDGPTFGEIRIHYTAQTGPDEEVVLYGTFDTQRIWFPGVWVGGWGGEEGHFVGGGFLLTPDCGEDGAHPIGHWVSRDGDTPFYGDGVCDEEAENCPGYEDDGGPGPGQSPMCFRNINVLASGVTGTIVSPSARSEACYTLAIVGGRSDPITRCRTIPAPEILDVRPVIYQDQKKFSVHVQYNNATGASMSGCSGPSSFQSGHFENPPSTEFVCDIRHDKQRHTLTVDGPAESVSKRYLFQMGEPQIRFETFGGYDPDGGPVEIGYTLSRPASLNELVTRTLPYYSDGRWQWMTYEVAGNRIGETVNVPWVKSIEVRTRGPLTWGAGPLILRVDPVRVASQATWRGNFDRRHHRCVAILKVGISADGTGSGLRFFERRVDLCNFVAEFRIEPTGGDTCYDNYHDWCGFMEFNGCGFDRCKNFAISANVLVSGRHLAYWWATCDDGWEGDFSARPSYDEHSLQSASWERSWTPPPNSRYNHASGGPFRCRFQAMTWDGRIMGPASGNGIEVIPAETYCDFSGTGSGDNDDGWEFEGRWCDRTFSDLRETQVISVSY